MENNVISELKNQTLYLTINRETKLNALNKDTLAEIHQIIKEADRNPEVLVIIITGAGSKAFVAGADISEFAHFNKEQGKELSKRGHEEVFNWIENCSKPVIAAINGFALGGGLELAMACHIRVASANAKMGLPEVSLGIIPGYGGTQRLTKLVGKGKAVEMITTADMMNAEEALRWGLINHITEPENLITFCEGIAAKIRTRSPRAIAAAIRAVNASDKSNGEGYLTEIEEFGNCFGSEDFKEGTSAFLEKRKPAFTGK